MTDGAGCAAERAPKPSITAIVFRALVGAGAIGLLATSAVGGAPKDLEQSGVYLDACPSHFPQLEHDAREVAREFCADLGGVDGFEPFEQSEEIIRENEYSTKYRCTVRGRVACYADE